MNKSGQVTIDFLFASVLILSVTTLLMALTMSLTFAELIQYVSFSAARCYFAADDNEAAQITAAEAKANALLTNGLPFLRGAINNEWIKVTGGAIGPNNTRARNYKDYAQNLGVASQTGQSGDSRNQFVGYQLSIEIPILSLTLPMLGTVTAPDGGSFNATISSMLLREPTRTECEGYNNQAFDVLVHLHTPFSTAQSKSTLKNFAAINDNGC